MGLHLVKKHLNIKLCTVAFLFVTLAGCSAQSVNEPSSLSRFQTAYKAYQQKNYSKAFEIWQNIANEGDSSAQYNLALMYENGHEVKRNLARANYWYEVSANNNNVLAQKKLGNMYYAGLLGVAKDYKKSFYWFHKAAKQNNAESLHLLGSQYFLGNGTKIDKFKALKYWRLALVAYKKEGNKERINHIKNDDIEGKICKKDPWLCK